MTGNTGPQDSWNRGGLTKGPRNLSERADTMVSVGFKGDT